MYPDELNEAEVQHRRTESLAEHLATHLAANHAAYSRLRVAARERLPKAARSNEIEVDRMTGRLLYEEGYFAAQGFLAGRAAIGREVRREIEAEAAKEAKKAKEVAAVPDAPGVEKAYREAEAALRDLESVCAKAEAELLAAAAPEETPMPPP